MKRIIVTAAEENYADLLKDLLSSLRQWKEPLADSIGVLDLGLSATTICELKAENTIELVRPEWDLVVD